MATVSVKMEGIDQLVIKLNALKYDAQYKGGRYALRKAAQLIRDKARENAQRLDNPTSRNKIYLNIVEKWASKQYKATGDLGFRIGVLGGARDYSAYGEITTGKSASDNPGGDTFYWRFVEFGSENNRAKPFMRPALEQNTQAATDVFIAQFDKAIDRALRKAAKAGG